MGGKKKVLSRADSWPKKSGAKSYNRMKTGKRPQPATERLIPKEREAWKKKKGGIHRNQKFEGGRRLGENPKRGRRPSVLFYCKGKDKDILTWKQAPGKPAHEGKKKLKERNFVMGT